MREGHTFPSRCKTRLLIVVCLSAFGAAHAFGVEASIDSAPTTMATAAGTLPDPIYWRQVRFLIPYQLNAAAEPASAHEVSLYVSKDAGQNWQQISQAEPQLRAFTYHAEADGEYWFAIRTTDGRGAFWPTGPMQPELRVVVDTTVPRFESLTGTLDADGRLDISWRTFDANLDPNSWRIEYQAGVGGNWNALLLATPPAVVAGVCEGRSMLPAESAREAVAVRATVYDRAGNRATYQSSVAHAMSGDPVADTWPTIISARGGDTPIQPTPMLHAGAVSDGGGWTSSSTVNIPSPTTPASQPWPADRTAHAPLQFGATHDNSARPNSEIIKTPADLSNRIASGISRSPIPEPMVGDRPLGNIPIQPHTQPQSTIFSAEPFHNVSLTHSARANTEWPTNNDTARHGHNANTQPVTPSIQDSIAKGRDKFVNSRSFSLEYQLEDVGPEGVSKVELWGTRDAGRTWRNFAADDDNHSPLTVTVDGEGRYGFRIVVEGVGGVGLFPPQAGDEPELWVNVDLRRPAVRLSGVENGRGDLSGQLIVRWAVEDDNLGDRPIALYYSSRPNGPWSAIATRIANSGEYHWQLERHVPARIYLRLEARDLAGNMAACQTKEPAAIETAAPVAKLQPTEPIATAASAPSSR